MGGSAPAEAGLARRSACGGVGTASSLIWGEAGLIPVECTNNLSCRAPVSTLYSKHTLSETASVPFHGKALPQVMHCMPEVSGD